MKKLILKDRKLKSNNIAIPGYKHSTVALIALSVIYNNDYEFSNVPDVKDTRILVDILKSLGKKIEYEACKLKISESILESEIIPDEYSEQIHGSLYLIPAILGIKGKTRFCKSGGCKIGNSNTESSRPIEHMIKVMESFGADFTAKNEGIIGTLDMYRATKIDIMDFSENPKELAGPCVSGATKTAVICSLGVKKGVTYIHNPYLKPDVTEMLEVMSKLGFSVDYNSERIIIEPPTEKRPKVVEHYIVSDVTEIVTYISLSVYCDLPLTLSNITLERVKKALKPEFEYLTQMGIKLDFMDNLIRIPLNTNISPINIDVFCMGIYSDSQPFFTLMLLKATGESQITEFVWKNRFHYALELNKLGTTLEVNQNTLKIKPKLPSHGGVIIAKDLRSAAALVIAALLVKDEVEILGIEHLERGYVAFEENLRKIGVTFICSDV